MKNKKILSLLLLTAMMLSLILSAACNKKDDSIATQNTGNEVREADKNPTSDENGDVKLLPDLPEVYYNDYTFNVVISGNSELGTLRNDFHAAEQTGDVINDERYKRNVYVEDKYGVKIADKELEAGDPKGYDAIKKMVSTGEYTYDAGMIAGYAACKLAMDGYLWDLNDLHPLDLSKPWWDQKANSDLTIQGKMFYTTGDISTANNDATYCILFNKQLAQDYNVENLYELVKSGKWTMDKFVEIASTVSGDLNGDGAYDTNDLYGALIWDDSMMGIINAAGEKCCTIMEDGNIEITLYSEKTLDMFNKYTSLVFNKELAHTYQRKNWDGVAANTMFANDQALFFVQLMTLVTDLRAMDTNFGILPYPKYSESQESYYNTVGSWHSVFMCVPGAQENPERTGTILEALAAESRYTVKPAYYDICLKGKQARDEESLEMLDIIFATRTYDVGWFYQVGNYNEDIMNLLRNFKNTFTSMYEKKSNSAQRQVDKINATFAETLN